MRHKLREKFINRLHAKLNRGHDQFLEVLGHGCPTGIEPIALDDTVKEVEVYKQSFLRFNGDITSYLKEKQVQETPKFEGNITPFVRGFLGGPCRMYQITTVIPQTNPLFHSYLPRTYKKLLTHYKSMSCYLITYKIKKLCY
jgi:hypothetical protein